jgi:type IV pilus assembly protein PilM
MDILRFFIEDIKNFFSSERVTGVDIGTTSLKFVELSKSKDKIRLKNYGLLETREYLDRGNGFLQTSALKLDPTVIAGLLKMLTREAGLQGGKFIASIPSFAAFFTPLDLPLMSPAETAKAAMFQARQYIPLPIEQVNLDWSKIGESGDVQSARTQRIVLVATPKETVAL